MLHHGIHISGGPCFTQPGTLQTARPDGKMW